MLSRIFQKNRGQKIHEKVYYIYIQIQQLVDRLPKVVDSGVAHGKEEGVDGQALDRRPLVHLRQRVKVHAVAKRRTIGTRYRSIPTGSSSPCPPQSTRESSGCRK
jgi:hypothetical protein